MTVQVFTLYKELPAVQIENECTHCGDLNRILLDKEGFILWQQGEFVRNAWPHLSQDERELVISGTHKECWDAMFGDEE